jgi:hypothetical protein
VLCTDSSAPLDTCHCIHALDALSYDYRMLAGRYRAGLPRGPCEASRASYMQLRRAKFIEMPTQTQSHQPDSIESTIGVQTQGEKELQVHIIHDSEAHTESKAHAFRRKEQPKRVVINTRPIWYKIIYIPSVSLALPPPGWHKTVAHELHGTTVCAWENTVVIAKHPAQEINLFLMRTRQKLTRALYVHKVRIGRLYEPLELVLSLLVLVRRVKEVNCESLQASEHVSCKTTSGNGQDDKQQTHKAHHVCVVLVGFLVTFYW